jgi:hypothetical protein
VGIEPVRVLIDKTCSHLQVHLETLQKKRELWENIVHKWIEIGDSTCHLRDTRVSF